MVKVEQIHAVLRKHDLEGLIRMGAPDDEYDLEARLIHHIVVDMYQKRGKNPSIKYPRPSVEELVDVVYGVFGICFSFKHFGSIDDLSTLRRLSKVAADIRKLC